MREIWKNRKSYTFSQNNSSNVATTLTCSHMASSPTCRCEASPSVSRKNPRTAFLLRTRRRSPSGRPSSPCTPGCCTYWFPPSWTAPPTGSLSSCSPFAPCSTSAPRVCRCGRESTEVGTAAGGRGRWYSCIAYPKNVFTFRECPARVCHGSQQVLCLQVIHKML